jgi:PEP-CTERM/exosortase A-associated glycosyltransferase
MARPRILHVLHHSLPVSDGYSIRSRYLLALQREIGWEVAAVTSAQHADPARKPAPGREEVEREEVEGVPHYRTHAPAPPRLPLLREWALMRALRARLREAIREWQPWLVHVHSPVLCALPALAAARGLPVVYEIRDLWENASVDRGKFAHGSALYRLAQRLEDHALRRASAVVTIGECLREEVARRCPSARRLHVVPNGVDLSHFEPGPPDGEARRRWNPDGAPLLAYAGAFQPYEGLDVLLRGFELLLRSRPEARLLLAGSGPEDAALRRLAGTLSLRDRVTFAGRIPHEEVGSLYSIADALVYPRRRTRTTALTTPLKPLEAMALGKAVLASDLPALRELVRPGETGLLFPADDPGALLESCLRLLAEPALRERLGEQGRRYVEAERQWGVLVRRYEEVYRPLFSEQEARSGRGGEYG